MKVLLLLTALFQLSSAMVQQVAKCPVDTVFSTGIVLRANGVVTPIYVATTPKVGQKNTYVWLKTDVPVTFQIDFPATIANLDILRKPRNPVNPISSNSGKTWTFTVQSGDFAVIEQSGFRLFLLVDRIQDQNLNLSDPQIINVSSKGVDNTGKALASPGIQAAIDEASTTSKKIVYVPAGTYLCGTLFLKSNVRLHLEEGAYLKAAPNKNAWKWEHDPVRLSDKDFSSSALLMFKTIGTDTIRNAKVTGRGVIDGQGDFFRRPSTAADPCNEPTCYERDSTHYAKGVMFHNAYNCSVEGIMVRNSVFWNMQILGGRYNAVKYCKILGNYRVNNDGINFDNTSNSRVDNVVIVACDDGICWKSTHMFKCDEPNRYDSVTNSVILAPGYPTFKFGWALHFNYYGHIENVYAHEYMKWEATKRFWSGSDPNVRVSNFTFKHFVVKGGFQMNPSGNTNFWSTNNRFVNCSFGDGISLLNADTLSFVNTKVKGKYVTNDAGLSGTITNSKNISYSVNGDTAPPVVGVINYKKDRMSSPVKLIYNKGALSCKNGYILNIMDISGKSIYVAANKNGFINSVKYVKKGIYIIVVKNKINGSIEQHQINLFRS